MNVKEINTKIDFTKTKSLEDSKRYVERTLRDASRMDIHITWGFDEAQSGTFYRGWTGDRFLQCIKQVLENNNAENSSE